MLYPASAPARGTSPPSDTDPADPARRRGLILRIGLDAGAAPRPPGTFSRPAAARFFVAAAGFPRTAANFPVAAAENWPFAAVCRSPVVIKSVAAANGCAAGRNCQLIAASPGRLPQTPEASLQTHRPPPPTAGWPPLTSVRAPQTSRPPPPIPSRSAQVASGLSPVFKPPPQRHVCFKHRTLRPPHFLTGIGCSISLNPSTNN